VLEDFFKGVNAIEDALAADLAMLITAYIVFMIDFYALLVTRGHLLAAIPDVVVALLGPIIFNATRLRCSTTENPQFLTETPR
jgi:hypothetical protein